MDIKYIKKRILIILLIMVPGNFALMAQKAEWNVNFFSFFDNIEFARSAYKIPQTLAGVAVSPELALAFDSVSRIHVGTSVMREFGSRRFIDRYSPLAYYTYDRMPVKFVMGAFPRNLCLDKYPRLFFQDSISYYRPNVNGMFAEFRRQKYYVNIWLDWTGRQSPTVHEAFFIGISGRYDFGIFNIRHYSYYYHFASKMNPAVDEALHDNALYLSMAGVDLSGKYFRGKLEANAGWLGGLERARADNTGWIVKNGFFSDIKVEYWHLGFYNTLYTGTKLMQFYRSHGNDLYWGDPEYRAGTADRADFYINFLRDRKIDIELTYSLHFLEGRIYNEQMLKVKINLGGRFVKAS